MKKRTGEKLAKPVQNLVHKYTLEPTKDQLQVLEHYAAAEKFTFNEFVRRNKSRSDRWMKRRQELMDQVHIPEEDVPPPIDKEALAKYNDKIFQIKKKLVVDDLKADVKRIKDDPKSTEDDYMHLMTSFEWQKTWVTAIRHEHEELAKNGQTFWVRFTNRNGEEVFQEKTPWLHTVNRRVMVSGANRAHKAMQAYMSSRMGARSGPRVGKPRLKRRDSVIGFEYPTALVGVDILGYQERSTKKASEVNDYSHIHVWDGRFGGPFKIATSRHGKGRSTRSLLRDLQKHPRNKIAQVIFSRDRGVWTLSVVVDDFTPRSTPNKKQVEGGPVGVDLGVKYMAALSTDEFVENPRSWQKLEKDIKFYQRKLSRQEGSKKGEIKSEGYKKTQVKLAKLKRLQAARRATAQHSLTKTLMTSHDLVVIEDLKVANMTKSAKGTLESPGKNVKAKAGLNRAMLDVGFGEIRRQLDYKADRYGSQLVTVNPAYTSKMCSSCGDTRLDLTLGDRVFVCASCGNTMDRDLNAAKNILDRGLKQLAEGDE